MFGDGFLFAYFLNNKCMYCEASYNHMCLYITFQVSDNLPTSQTCFFQLRLPSYTSQEVLAERLRYAITHCRSIDMDTYMLRGGDHYDDDSVSPPFSDDDDLYA